MTKTGAGARAGRKRDASRDQVILDATLSVLAELGYEGTTIDLVADRAGMARATIYRRWSTKADLVLQAVARLSHDDVDLEHLPDTGTLRGDLVAVTRPFDEQEQQVRIQAVVGLMTLSHAEPRLAEAASEAAVGPWITVNRRLIQRAIDRGEVAVPTDLETLAGVLPMLCIARAAQRLPITAEFGVALIDGVLLPALRGAAT